MRRFLPGEPKFPLNLKDEKEEERETETERDVPSFVVADVLCASGVDQRRPFAALRPLLGSCPSLL